MADIGIDLGATHSVLAHYDNEPKVIENKGRPKTPSVVAYSEDDSELLVGQAARDEAFCLPSVRFWRRDIGADRTYELGGKTYTPVDLSAMILAQVKAAAEERLNEPVDIAVISVPAYVTGPGKEATLRAAQLAGLKNVRLLAEPVAAALAFGSKGTVLVYDLGSSTFDVTIIDCVDYRVLGLDGDNYLGGDNFDKLLLAHLAKEVKRQAGIDLESSPHALQHARRDCEKAKIKLSDSQSATILVQAVVGGTPVNAKMKVTRDVFERMIMPLVDETIHKVERVVGKAILQAPKFAKEDIDSVLLVGGSTHIPLVQRRLRDYFGKEPSKKIHPELAVAFGAAMYAASIPVEEGIHRIAVKPVPNATAQRQVTIEGRTSPGAALELRTPLGFVDGKADEGGRFFLTAALAPNSMNTIRLLATSSSGEQRRRQFTVQRDDSCHDEEVVEVIADPPIVWPRPLGIRVVGQDDRLRLVVGHHSVLPFRASAFCCVTPSSRGAPSQCLIEVYEGDLPYALLNTRLAQLVLIAPPSVNMVEPLEVAFRITEDCLLVVTACLVNFPDHRVTATIKERSCSGDNLGVLDRLDHLLRGITDKIRPEERARLNKTKMRLLDLCQQYKRDPQKDEYEKIKETGLQLRTEVAHLEAQFAQRE